MLLDGHRNSGQATMLKTKMMTPMARSNGQLSAAADSSALESDASPTIVEPIPRPDVPSLYEIPADLHPTYRPLPLLLRSLTWLLSTVVAAYTTWERGILWIRPVMSLRTKDWRKLLSFAVKGVVTGITISAALQEAFFPPSRISTTSLLQRYFLPSKLSRYEPVVLPSWNDSTLGVHYLEYVNPQEKEERPRFDAVYVNHGFGASSLSWLPALQPLVDTFDARVGLGHDATGFGFTDRPSSVAAYSSYCSSEIGHQLLSSRLDPASGQSRSVLLFGHSMGCLATLRMALRLDPEIKQHIVLVAPALGFPRPINSKKIPSIPFPKSLIEVPASFLLRRLVSSKDFWRKGLNFVWGDASQISDSDCLRFHWPSLGTGWERALVRFSRAQSLPVDMSDEELVRRVSKLPNVTIDVLLGSKDRLIPKSFANKFWSKFKSIKVETMDGLGHDPFEEDVAAFVRKVEGLLNR